MTRHIHFIGISGAGLAGLAQVMLGRGETVTGSDPAAPNPVTAHLETLGAKIYSNHVAENIAGADLIVATSAAQSDNPEIAAAHLQQIPVLKRREFLREITAGFDVIAVAGSHGKTTTTAMIAKILEEAGLDPTVVVGGIVPGWDTGARLGNGSYFVIEADEYDYAFLGLEPKIAVLTNVEYDHPDIFPTREAYRQAFADFLKQTRAEGVIVVCGDEEAAERLASGAGARVLRYGFGEENGVRATDLAQNEAGGLDFTVSIENRAMGTGTLQVPGRHNVLNALGALTAARGAGVELENALGTVAQFRGVGRRFQVRGTYNGATIVDDYAHHPTEIRASLQAARMRYPKARIWALFQPHTFSRTRALLDDFAGAFGEADKVLITEIYAARERDGSGTSSRLIVERMKRAEARFVESLEGAEQILRKELQAGDVLVTLGAGDVNRVAIHLGQAAGHDTENA